MAAPRTIDRTRLAKLRAAGFTTREIAARLGTSQAYVMRLLAQTPREPVDAVSISAYGDGRIVITTTGDPVVVGLAVRRALERAGIPIASRAGDGHV